MLRSIDLKFNHRLSPFLSRLKSKWHLCQPPLTPHLTRQPLQCFSYESITYWNRKSISLIPRTATFLEKSARFARGRWRARKRRRRGRRGAGEEERREKWKLKIHDSPQSFRAGPAHPGREALRPYLLSTELMRWGLSQLTNPGTSPTGDQGWVQGCGRTWGQEPAKCGHREPAGECPRYSQPWAGTWNTLAVDFCPKLSLFFYSFYFFFLSFPLPFSLSFLFVLFLSFFFSEARLVHTKLNNTALKPIVDIQHFSHSGTE